MEDWWGAVKAMHDASGRIMHHLAMNEQKSDLPRENLSSTVLHFADSAERLTDIEITIQQWATHASQFWTI